MAVRTFGLHPGRTLFICVAIGSAVAVILLLEGFQEGLFSQLRQTVTGRGGDLIVVQAGVNNFVASRSFLPQRSRDRIERVAGVRTAHPLTMVPAIHEKAGRKVPILFIVYDSAGGPTAIRDGRTIEAPREIVIGRSLAALQGLSVGDPLVVADYAFTITGIADDAAVMFTPLVFITYDDLLDWYFDSDIVGDISSLPLLSFLLLDVEPGADIQSLRAAIEAAEPEGDVFAPRQLAANDAALGRTLFGPVMNTLIGISYALCLLVIAAITFTSVQAKRRDLGVLKALGFSTKTLVFATLLEALVLTLFALPLGLLLGQMIAWGIERVMPLYQVRVVLPGVLAQTGAAAIVLASAGALLPLRSVARLDPTLVFRR